MESGKNVTFFEQLFCFYQLVLVVWNSFGAKLKMSFISWVKQNWYFLWQYRKKLPFPHLGGLLGGNGGPGKIISPIAGAVAVHDSPLSSRSPYHLYSFSGVRHVCHDNDGWFAYALTSYPRLQALRPVEHNLIAFRTFDFLDKHISVQQNLMINS